MRLASEGQQRVLTGRNSEACTRLRDTRFNHRRVMKVFLAAGSVDLGAKALLDPMKETAQSTTFDLVIADRLTREL